VVVLWNPASQGPRKPMRSRSHARAWWVNGPLHMPCLLAACSNMMMADGGTNFNRFVVAIASAGLKPKLAASPSPVELESWSWASSSGQRICFLMIWCKWTNAFGFVIVRAATMDRSQGQTFTNATVWFKAQSPTNKRYDSSYKTISFSVFKINNFANILYLNSCKLSARV